MYITLNYHHKQNAQHLNFEHMLTYRPLPLPLYIFIMLRYLQVRESLTRALSNMAGRSIFHHLDSFSIAPKGRVRPL